MQIRPPLEDTVQKILKKRMDRWNRPVWITDICVRQTEAEIIYCDLFKTSYTMFVGEYSRKSVGNNRAARIIAQFKLLLTLGKNRKQEKALASFDNLVVRVLTPEFYFATQNSPLSQDEFKYIMTGIKEIIEEYRGMEEMREIIALQARIEEMQLKIEEKQSTDNKMQAYLDKMYSKIAILRTKMDDTYSNLHVVLSSFHVLHQSEIKVYAQDQKTYALKTVTEVMNISLYIQCGSKPQIDVITKQITSDLDINYPNLKKYAFSTVNTDPVIVPTTSSSPYNISHQNVIHCQTKSGPAFAIAVEICIENSFSKAKRNYFLDRIIQAKNKSLATPFCSHLLISNTCEFKSISFFTPCIAHIDPFKPYTPNPFLHSTCNIEELQRTVENIPLAIENGTPLFDISQNRVLIKNTFFGGDISIELKPPQFLGGEDDNFVERIAINNYISECITPAFFNIVHAETPYDGLQSEAMLAPLNFDEWLYFHRKNMSDVSTSVPSEQILPKEKKITYRYHPYNIEEMKSNSNYYSDDDDSDNDDLDVNVGSNSVASDQTLASDSEVKLDAAQEPSSTVSWVGMRSVFFNPANARGLNDTTYDLNQSFGQ